MLLALLLLAAVIFGAAAEIPKVPGGDFEAHELVLEGEKKITLYTGPGEVFKTRNQLTPGTKVMSFGTEDGYTLICYEAGKHQYRFAWVRGVLDERLSPAKHEKTQVIRKIDLVSTDRRVHDSNFGRTRRNEQFKDFASVLRARLKNGR